MFPIRFLYLLLIGGCLLSESSARFQMNGPVLVRVSMFSAKVLAATIVWWKTLNVERWKTIVVTFEIAFLRCCK